MYFFLTLLFPSHKDDRWALLASLPGRSGLDYQSLGVMIYREGNRNGNARVTFPKI
jgi:hypothetical protein